MELELNDFPTLRQRVDKITHLLREKEEQTTAFAKQTGLFCPPGCGRCCESPSVEVTIADWLPMAYHLVATGQADQVLLDLDNLLHQGDSRCTFYARSELLPGRCTAYELRPMLCRLFAYATRRDRHAKRELVACAIHKQGQSESLARAQQLIDTDSETPDFQSSSLMLLGLEPELARSVLSINESLRKAIHYVGLRLSLSTT